MPSKTSCPVSRQQFRDKAPKKLVVTIGGKSFDAMSKEFSTGSLGFNVNDKLAVEIDGKLVQCQVGLNVTVVGSKDLPK